MSSSESGASSNIRLFWISCASLTAVAFNFAAIGAAMFSFRQDFGLTNAETGWIGGAGIWGIAVAQLVFAPFCDAFGPKRLLWFALAGHLAGAATMIGADGFAMLFVGALVLSVANGLVEAACNPLVATIYPERKAVMLNRFHLFFPGGIAAGGLLIHILAQMDVGGWRGAIAVTLVPTLFYGALLIGTRFPQTEVKSAGLTVGDTLRALAKSRLLWILLCLMAITASLELAPNRWIPAVLEAGGMAGILVLVLINGIMAVLRAVAPGAIFARVPPTLFMGVSCLVTALGLWLLSSADGTAAVLTAAVIFAFGIALMWPTMIGLVSERVPQSGAVGLGLMATVGSAVVGLIATPLLGGLVDARMATADALDPIAESRAGLEAIGVLVPFAIFASFVFLSIYWRDRTRGGYQAAVDQARLKAMASSAP
ncbi:MAG: MFS transporter [Erythrobacter sp.]|uniref:MFS transporter n=1 Tax=Erythrobacter sp. TaxID=1042 RepID=UPI00261F4235|nr:MFS transporter [Erythrobacter sp.]MDJ0978175.1 MFS transporter [Erythrobacter sp.]